MFNNFSVNQANLKVSAF